VLEPLMSNQRGLTLLELVIALAVVAIVASIAMPSFGSAADRARLRHAAESFAADLAEARFQSAQRGVPLYLDAQPGPGWCWAVTSAPGCRCGVAQACQLKTVRESDNPGVQLIDAHAISFDPAGTTQSINGSDALLQSRRGERLRVSVSALGRASICAPDSAVPGYPAC
jgi:type IV fimbrial biogenesis protein FimT